MLAVEGASPRPESRKGRDMTPQQGKGQGKSGGERRGRRFLRLVRTPRTAPSEPVIDRDAASGFASPSPNDANRPAEHCCNPAREVEALIDSVSRRIDDLARQLNIPTHLDDKGDRPRAA
jgi:hypothetical protein